MLSWSREFVLPAVSILALGAGCGPDVYPLYWGAGADAMIYDLEYDGKIGIARLAQERIVLRETKLYDQKRQALRWSSRWASDKPWCAFLVKDIDPNKKPDERDKETPASELACIAPGDTKITRIAMTVPFPSATVDPEGKYLLLHSGTDGVDEDSFEPFSHEASEVLFNRNLVAVINLEDFSTRTMTLNGFGAELELVEFPEVVSKTDRARVEIGGQARRIVAFSADQEIILADVDDADLHQVAVRIEADAGNGRRRVLRIRPGDEHLEDPLLLIASTTRDVEALTLVNPSGSGPGFSAQYSIYSLFSSAADITFLTIEEAPWMAAATDSGMVFTELSSASQFQIPETGAVNHIEQIEDASGALQLLVWGDDKQDFYRLDAASLASSLGRTPERFHLGEAIASLRILSSDRVAVQGQDLLTFVGLSDHVQTPFIGGGTRDSSHYFFDGTEYFIVHGLEDEGGTRVSRINLNTLVPETVQIRYPAQSSMVFVPSQSTYLLALEGPMEKVTLMSLGQNAEQLDELTIHRTGVKGRK